jgi:hypothetical protein
MQQMSEANQEERFMMSRNFRRWSKERLERIFYSDESHICLKQNGIQYVRKYDDEDWNDKQFRKVASVHPLAINIWMLISYEKGVERIKWTSTKTWINGQYYRDNVLARYILDDDRLKIGSDYGGMFQHDRAQGHMAKATTGLLKDHDINVVPWPPKGADLSPIENCFCEIQRRAKVKFSDITKVEELWEYVSEMVLKDDFTDFIRKCYDNVRDRWEEVYKSEGGPTRY